MGGGGLFGCWVGWVEMYHTTGLCNSISYMLLLLLLLLLLLPAG